MTGAPLSGPGLGLQTAQYLYPSELTNAPVDFSSNRLALAPGQAIALPRGTWLVDLGMYCVLQFLDSVSNQWNIGVAPGWDGGIKSVDSDGFNVRIANMLGCPIGAIVTNQGTSYTQATATVTPTAGNSVWSPVIGGALSLTSVAAQGGGYGIPPLVLLPAPPGPSNNPNSVGGVAAAAYSTIAGAGGSLSTITFTNQGAGYPSAAAATIVPDPYDPNINSGITAASVVIGLNPTSSGGMTAALCTNPGAALTTAQLLTGLTLTTAGTSGVAATLSAIIPQTIIGLTTVSTVGSGYPAGGAALFTYGGTPSLSQLTTPSTTHLSFRPRQPNILLATSGTGIASISTIYDGGFFEAAPSPLVIGGAPTTAAALTLSMGSVADHVILQALRT